MTDWSVMKYCASHRTEGQKAVPLFVDKQKKRQVLIEAAVAVFSRNGYQRTKMNDIAHEAGVGKGTLYEYFPSKRKLFVEMSEYLYEQFMVKQRDALDSVEDPEQRIHTLISATLEQTALWTRLMHLFIDVWAEMDREGEEDELRRIITRVYRKTADILAGYIREGQTRGQFKPCNAEDAALAILAVLDGLVFQHLINKRMFETKSMISTLTKILVEGLKK
jgi:AcrR family transcriptional regulator